jgi:hypothetical protein
MRHSRLDWGLCLLLALAAAGCGDDDNRSLFEASPLSGANEVPSNASGASGSAGFDVDGSTVSYSVEVRGITGILFAHVHSGAAGTNGPVRVNLFLGPQTGAVDGLLVQGTFTSSDVVGISFEDLLSEMRAGTAYVNVHTVAFPGGEIRAQLRPLQ